MSNPLFISRLESIVRERLDDADADSYTAQLAAAGIKRVAQKVGEEAVEVALAATAGNREELVDEAADLIYHLLVLLAVRNISILDIDATLAARHRD